ncbi:6-phosphogluconolactonase [Chelativorans sp. AA-79]|uniref:6-phosphogluconolactonase n=1 Tax=Chelativorans sp. AA-79 TaxID=3028735 RepID=UPI0023FA4640|nr:6-phosphogluconolactonase [Chelativorans sp. AA-79]WEX08764.1 6-phosphogluconolactonase [Chelativorans sp. AA-79]
METYRDREKMGAAAAAAVAAALAERLHHQDHVRMVFAAAPSQSSMLEQLCAAEGVDWRRVSAFHMDEFIGLAPEAPQRFANWLDRHLFGKVPFKAVHKLAPEPDPEEEALRYARLLDEAPIDFVCLGIGVNGHIAFNDPPVADFDDPRDVKVIELDEICRRQQIDDQGFASMEEVPPSAITLTIPRLLRADRLFCIVPGAHKRDAVRGALRGPVTTACPASILRRHPDCTLFLDKEADPDA